MSIRLKRCFFFKNPIIYLVFGGVTNQRGHTKRIKNRTSRNSFCLAPPCFFGAAAKPWNLYNPSAAGRHHCARRKKNIQFEVAPGRTKIGWILWSSGVGSNPSWSRNESLSIFKLTKWLKLPQEQEQPRLVKRMVLITLFLGGIGAIFREFLDMDIPLGVTYMKNTCFFSASIQDLSEW